MRMATTPAMPTTTGRTRTRTPADRLVSRPGGSPRIRARFMHAPLSRRPDDASLDAAIFARERGAYFPYFNEYKIATSTLTKGLFLITVITTSAPLGVFAFHCWELM